MFRRGFLNNLFFGGPIIGAGLASASPAHADDLEPNTDSVARLRAELANRDNPAIGAALVGFKHPGSSSGRTVLAKLSDTISVKDFGAQGSGGDDTAAIQAALDYAGDIQNGSIGGIVFLPKGDYRIAAPLTLPNMVHFMGEGYASILRTVGPEFSGPYMISLGGEGQNVFGTRVIGMRLHQYGGSIQKAVVYSESMNQQCGVFDVYIDGLSDASAIMFVAGKGTNGPAMAEINNVNIAALGDVENGIHCNVGGMILKMSHVSIETGVSNRYRRGIFMEQDILAGDALHFEGCREGIAIGPESLGGSATVVTGHSTTEALVSIDAKFHKGGVKFDCLTNTSIETKGLTVLQNLKTGENFQDLFLTSYSYTATD